MKRVLFITKNYPPQIGGMEDYSYNFYNYLSKYTKVYLISNKRGKWGLSIFGLKVLIKGIYFGLKSDLIYIGDGSISIVGLILGKLLNKKIYITIHGLDITRNKRIYQKIIPKIISKYNKIICVSGFTKQECIKRGINAKKIVVIQNGICFDTLSLSQSAISKDKMFTKYNILTIGEKKILLTIGRLIERKGIHRFLENIYSKLDQDNYIYLIAGSGKYREIYKEIINKKNYKNVYLLGNISQEEKSELYQMSDLFVMPNIKVNGDMEGFGIVIIEAGSFGLPTIGSKIEGIKDTVIDGKSGILINDDTNKIENRIDAINKFSYQKLPKSEIKKTVKEKFDRFQIIKQYLNILKINDSK